MSAGTLVAGYIAASRESPSPWLEDLRKAGLTPAPGGLETDADASAWARGAAASCRLGDGGSALLVGAPYHLGAEQGTPKLEAIAGGLLEHPETTLASLGGPFAIAVVCPSRQEILLAVDRFAIENLFFTHSAEGIAFANRSRTLAAHPAVGNRFSLQGVFESIYFHWLPGPSAGYLGMERLLPGHYAHWRAGKLEIKPYWQPRFDVDTGATEAAQCAALRDSLELAVTRRLPERHAACFLSGGLDSSTVTGFAAKHRPEDTVAYTIGFEADGYDEMEFARTVARHFGVRHESYYVTPDDVIDALPAIVDEFDAPFGNASAIPTYYCAKLAAEHGHRSMLAGDGGDELFGGNARYSKQLVFEHYWRMPAPLRKGLLEPLLAHSPLGRLGGPFGKAASYVRQASVPLPDRLMTYNLLNFVRPETFLHPDVLAGLDFTAPSRVLRDMYEAPADTDTLNRLLKLDWRITLADSDLPKVSRMCALAGVDVSYPMLDEAVVDASLRLPPATKATPTALRPLFRKAFADFLPEATLTKSKQGFGLPFGVWLHTKPRMMDFAEAQLSGLASSGLLRDDFPQKFLSGRLQDHPAYYGTLAWILIALSLWLRGSAVILDPQQQGST
jgi:asparagine synthase (glutamine-hydrolysing)